MTFLNPALLFGLLAASIPILIHLLNLRKLQKVEFSTLAFLKELQKTKVRKIRLKQWILLLLRVLIILFLVMSFARPALQSVSIGLGSTTKTSAVIIIDNSFSMSVVNEGGSYLNQAKAAAKNILNEFTEGDEVTIITIDGNDSESFTSSNKPLLLKNIEEIKTGLFSRDLVEPVKYSLEKLGASKNFNKEIYILSDFQTDRFTEQEEAAIQNSGNVKVYLLPFTGNNVNNLSINQLRSENQIFELNKAVTFTAVVKNNSSVPSSNNVVSLFVNGKRTAQQSFDIQAGESIQVEFEQTLASPGFIDLFAELEEDDIQFDNRSYMKLYVPEQIKILALADEQNDLSYFNIALEGINNTYFDIEKSNTSRINSFDLASYNVVVLSGNNYAGNIQKLRNYIEAGGSVILFPGASDENADISEITNGLNIPTPESFVKSDESFFSFGQVDYEHPVFTELFEDDKKQIDSPDIYKYLKIFNKGRGKTIISLLDGAAFLSEYSLGNGKVLLFSSLPTLSWSNFPVKGIFAPLINKVVSYLSFAKSKSDRYIVGDEINVSGSSLVQPQVKVIKPDNTEEYIQPELKGFNKMFTYPNTDINGIYKFYNELKLFETVSVNLDSRESGGSYLDIDEVEELLAGLNSELNIIELDKNDNFSEKISQARFGTELWKLFLIIALALALIEMLVSKSSKKDMAAVKG